MTSIVSLPLLFFFLIVDFMFFFFFNDPATTEIYTLSLHDALPISVRDSDRTRRPRHLSVRRRRQRHVRIGAADRGEFSRSEEHTSELQSQFHLVCRLLLEKKNNQIPGQGIPDDDVHPDDEYRAADQ